MTVNNKTTYVIRPAVFITARKGSRSVVGFKRLRELVVVRTFITNSKKCIRLMNCLFVL